MRFYKIFFLIYFLSSVSFTWAVTYEPVTFSVQVEEKYLGEVPVIYNPANNYLLIQTEELLDVLKPSLKHSEWERLSKLLSKNKYTSPYTLLSLGIKPFVNFSFFSIKLEISPPLKNPNRINVFRYKKKVQSGEDSRKLLNGYMNYSIGRYFNGSQEEDPAFFNPILSYWNWSLENNLQYKENEKKLIRYGSRLIHDDTKRLERVILGEQSTQTQYLDFNFSFLGASVTKEYNITPQYQYRLLGSQEFILEAPSRVEIYVNSILTQVLQLPAGPHKLEDIPLARGINSVVLKIIDGSGEEKVLVKQLSIDQDMLSKGHFLYGLYAGKLFITEDIKPTLIEEHAATIFMRYGFSETLTTGIQMLVSEKVAYHNLNNTFSTPIGSFRHDLKLSKSLESKHSGIGSRQAYFWMCPCWLNSLPIRFTLYHEYESEEFLSAYYPYTQYNHTSLNRIGTNYNIQFLGNTSIQLGHSRAYASSEEIERNLDASLSLTFGWKLNAVLHWRQSQRNDHLSRLASIQVNYFFDQPNTYISHRSQNSNERTFGQTDLFYNQNKRNNNFATRTSYSHSNNQKEIQNASTFSAPFADISGEFKNSKTDRDTENSVFMGLRGSVAFVGNDWGFGRTIHDSFILVRNNLEEDITINGNTFNNEMYVPGNSSRLLTITQAYYPKDVIINSAAEDSLESKRFSSTARYKHGAKVSVKDDFQPTILGRFDLKDLAPIKTALGASIKVNDENLKFFVTEDGKFIIENIPSGTFEVTLFWQRPIKTTIFVPKSKERIIDVGLQTLSLDKD